MNRRATTPELMTVAEVADLLQIRPKTVLAWVRRGRLAATELPSGRLRFSRSAVLLARAAPMRLLVTTREAAALVRLLDGYLIVDYGDPGVDDLRSLQSKARRLDQDHCAYDQEKR